MNRFFTLAVAVLVLVLLCGIMTGCRRDSGNTFPSEIELELPWELGGKDPADYTWEEFEKLTPEQSIAFQNYLGESGFKAWMNSVKEPKQEQISEVLSAPWEEAGAKKPEDYTWEEFETLTPEQSIAFQNYLGEGGFETWMNSVKEPEQEQLSETVFAPWEEAGAKQPDDYAWEEFEALSPEQSIIFQNSFENSEAFEDWMRRVRDTEEDAESPMDELELPWNQEGAKQPDEYSWEEFEALDGILQIAFQNSFEGFEAFDKWLQKVNPQ